VLRVRLLRALVAGIGSGLEGAPCGVDWRGGLEAGQFLVLGQIGSLVSSLGFGDFRFEWLLPVQSSGSVFPSALLRWLIMSPVLP
jgi:hypothetical protein